jgi:hypothetical protein
MINLNLHGRHPKDLPDKETINDILLELHDTNKFHISIKLSLQLLVDLNNDWRGNGKFFDNWKERGQVVTCEMNNPLSLSYSSEPANIPYVTETRYDIIRYPIRISVKFNSDYSTLSKELIDNSKEVLLRLKDYIGPDVIQDQYGSTGFDIDFMISDIKVIV